MTPEQFQRVQKILPKARALDDAARAGFLDQQCPDDAEIRAEIESLLKSEPPASKFLDEPALGSAFSLQPTVVFATPAPEAIPEAIGPYHILSVLGEGGFGVVFLAERRKPFIQKVAIKVLRRGLEGGAVARFEHERQALAVLDHPNVAKVFDAGTTEHGRPFFVMEYVHGEPLNAYCDRQQLSLRDRLELFIPVCEAIQHAHSKGIIHRDLKSSNILVASRDNRTVPKVIDFGVAKAVNQAITGLPNLTEAGQFVGTPEYMSPEQAAMGQVDIDTRSDVYGLGVVLYELMCGLLPFDSERLRLRGYLEACRIIREEQPPKPSERFAKADYRRGEIADHRRTTQDDLERELRRELDWVPLKAMRKDRVERYATAKQLGDDLRRYLDGKPLEAGPESRLYRARKALDQHRLVAAGVAIAIGFLLMPTAAVVAEAVKRPADGADLTASPLASLLFFIPITLIAIGVFLVVTERIARIAGPAHKKVAVAGVIWASVALLMLLSAVAGRAARPPTSVESAVLSGICLVVHSGVIRRVFVVPWIRAIVAYGASIALTVMLTILALVMAFAPIGFMRQT
ncbi:MAG: serine/threonine protein kinase [Phycisphaerales bacterium]